MLALAFVRVGIHFCPYCISVLHLFVSISSRVNPSLEMGYPARGSDYCFHVDAYKHWTAKGDSTRAKKQPRVV